MTQHEKILSNGNLSKEVKQLNQSPNVLSKEKLKKIMKDILIASTIGIAGPSGNGKSTLFAYLVSPLNNIVLGQNIGDKSQTSLVNTLLALNSSLEVNKVFIKCKRKIIPTHYKKYILREMQEKIYELRDELDEFKIEESSLRRIFNPITKEYHAYKYLIDKNIETEDFLLYLNEMAKFIIEGDEELEHIEDDVNKLYKQLKNKNPKPKKKEIYANEIEKRFYLYNDGDLSFLAKWFTNFENGILMDYHKFWDMEDEYAIFGDISSESKIKEFMSLVYDRDSVFSLVFSEVIYATRPSDEFIEAYRDYYKLEKNSLEDKPLILNILDTRGVTHVSDDKEDITNSIDEILSNNMDAMMFLCAADERETTYETCMNILVSKKLLKEIPVTLCRTKADIIIQSKLNKIYRVETGKNEIPQNEIKSYTERAFLEFKDEYINPKQWKNKENTIGFNKNNSNPIVEYLALSPNTTRDLKIILGNELEENKLFNILLNLNTAVEKYYASNGLYRVHQLDNSIPAISINFDRMKVLKISNDLVKQNHIHKNGQYYKYKTDADYHGNSINSFYYKHINGNGHETRALVYANFRIFIKNMIAGWLRKEDIFCLNLDFSNMIVVTGHEDYRERINNDLRGFLHNNKEPIIMRLSKKISYDFLQSDFHKCYDWVSLQTGFFNSLELFSTKFSDINYWSNCIEKGLRDEINLILGRMILIK